MHMKIRHEGVKTRFTHEQRERVKEVVAYFRMMQMGVSAQPSPIAHACERP